MPLLTTPPYSAVEPVTDVLHGVSISDPYRWLEDTESAKTRAWLEEQTRYARAYLERIPGREQIRKRIHQFLAVETFDSLQKVGSRYFFRKRLAEQEQPCIYMREGTHGDDQLLIDPSKRGTGKYTAVKPILVSPNGQLLLYEVKEGGERTGTFEFFDIQSRRRLPDVFSRGRLRGLTFAADGRRCYYVHEAVDAVRPFYRAAYEHVLGTSFDKDREIFFAGENQNIRLVLYGDTKRLVLVVQKLLEQSCTDVYVKDIEGAGLPKLIASIDYRLGLRLHGERILAITDRNAPNRRIVELRLGQNGEHEVIDLVPETDKQIRSWLVMKDRIFVCYLKETTHEISVFDISGERISEVPIRSDETVRMIGTSPESEELLFEGESFAEPIGIFAWSAKDNRRTVWAKRAISLESADYCHSRVWFKSRDGTKVPMFVVGHRDVLERHDCPTIMTSYGGYGVSMTPRFSVFVAFMMERGCLFALPNIRGGSEFGVDWHNAAKRRSRQAAFDDFLCAAEWLIETGRTKPDKLAIFGGSNSGLLVGAALTQRPDLFRAVVCMVPMLDMLRYHLFDNAHVWKEEFGTADRLDDFEALLRYSPYHGVRSSTRYPAVMLVSGDADGNCNPLHARKMTARLQASNVSPYPIFLDYNEHRGHSPVLPFSDRLEALTDRLAFLCDQLQLSV